MLLTIALALAAPPDSTPIRPSFVGFANPPGTLGEAVAAFSKQSGIPVEPPAGADATPCDVAFPDLPVWEALRRIAVASGMQVIPRENGRQVTLVRAGGSPPPDDVTGPFRMAVRQVRCVTDFTSGSTFTELSLDIHWEPRVLVFRIDAEPTITNIADDLDDRIPAPTARVRAPPTGSLFTTAVRIEGVPRQATRLTRVAGSFAVTATDRMIHFTVPLTERLPAAREQYGVRLSVARAERRDNRFEAAVELTYPEDHPEFDSYESFVTENLAELSSGGRVWPAMDFETSHTGRQVRAVYRFPADVPDGAEFRYTTPAPLKEFRIPFELRDVPLP